MQDSDYATAGIYTSPGSVASRCLTSQKLLIQAEEVDGIDTTNSDTPAIKPDPGSQSILVEDSAKPYTWTKFSYDADNLVRGWTGATGPVEDVLSTQSDEGEGLGTTATLKTAYKANSGSLLVVVQLHATRAVALDYGATYAAAGGYTQKSTQSSTLDKLDAGDTTLVYYAFKNAKFGGKIKLQIDSTDYQKQTLITLDVR